ncbi:MAG: ferric reductase-like transmembrane domain-containing protein [archaeon]|nr:ferric reductase-like transmembrane domain-containing protein [archaeon]
MNEKIMQYLFFIFLGISSIIFANIIFNPFVSQSISTNLLLYSVGKLAGLIGFLFLSVLIISGDTARFFDKFIGIDKIIKFQRKFALITAIFVIAHPLFFMLSSGNYLNYLIPNFIVLPLALGIISLYVFIIIMICSVLYKKISYQIWQYIHILTYILFFFSLYHALNVGSDTENIFVKRIFDILLIGIITGGIYRAYYKIKHKKFKYFVKEIKWETSDVFTLKLKPSSKLHFKPGQFCFLRINKNKLYARHPFTISSSPNEDTLDFTIKITGKFTKIASQLKEGEEVIIDGPFGIFTIKDGKKDLVFIAGGVGITPFISMIKNQLHFKKQQKITLLYGAKTEKDLIFKKELDKIKENWLKKKFILSKEEKHPEDWEKGYITRELIEKNADNLKNSIFYICGPELMKNGVVKTLKDMGIKEHNIIIESFFW